MRNCVIPGAELKRSERRTRGQEAGTCTWAGAMLVPCPSAGGTRAAQPAKVTRIARGVDLSSLIRLTQHEQVRGRSSGAARDPGLRKAAGVDGGFRCATRLVLQGAGAEWER